MRNKGIVYIHNFNLIPVFDFCLIIIICLAIIITSFFLNQNDKKKKKRKEKEKSCRDDWLLLKHNKIFRFERMYQFKDKFTWVTYQEECWCIFRCDIIGNVIFFNFMPKSGKKILQKYVSIPQGLKRDTLTTKLV